MIEDYVSEEHAAFILKGLDTENNERARPEGEICWYSVNGSWNAGRVGRPIESFSSIMPRTHDEEIKQAEYVSYNKCVINCVKCKLDPEEDIDVKFVGSFLSPGDR